MTEPNSKDNRETLEDMTTEETQADNGPDLDNGEGDFSAKLKSLYDRILAAAEEYHRVFFQSQAWDILQKTFPGITEEQAISISFMADDIIDYLPEIQEAIAEREKKTGKPITITDLLAGIEYVNEEKDRPGPCLLEDFLEEAQQIRKDRRGAIPRIGAKKPTKAGYPLDKVSGIIWSLLEEDTNGQLTFAMESRTDRRKKKRELNLIYSIDFSALEEEGVKVSKRLTQTDKRIYIAIAGLFNAGNEKITLSQIHEAMGNTGRPSKNQIERINESVYKMARAWITVNDSDEHKAYSYDIDEHRADGKGWTGGKYDGPLLPIERGQVIVNGQLAEAAIHLFREPPMLTFAKLRKQITSIDIKLLRSPVSKTEGNLSIEDYLLTRIAKAKGNGKSEKILFKTLFDKAGIKDKSKQKRTPHTVQSYLDHYIKEGFIESYNMERDSVTVFFAGKKKDPTAAGKN